MRRFHSILFSVLAALLALGPLGAQTPRKPKLILAITVDQFRYDYLTRFRADYTGGLHRLLTEGAVFTNARYEHFPTVTAVGHSTYLTGATPSVSGIVGNDWFDRELGRSVTSVFDPAVKNLGGVGMGPASPRRLLVSTIGDELKMASGGRSRVIGVSLKDRGAILPAGHMADGAYWFCDESGSFISSTFYFPDLPGWVKEFNSSRPADKYLGATWAGKKFLSEAGRPFYASLAASPFGNEMIELFAERAIQSERLGQRDAIDVLAVSFSSNDYVGHRLGPDAPEVRDISIKTDLLLDKLLRFADAQAGAGNVLVVLTADHGVSPMPEVNASRRMPGGRMAPGLVLKTVQAALEKKYGPGQWISSPAEYSLYLNVNLINQKSLDRAEVNRAAAEAALGIPHVLRVYTREQMMQGVAQDQIARRVMNGFHPGRAADIHVLLEPYWIFAQDGATHGTTFSYDAHVPVIFMGPGIRKGRYHQAAAVNDIAPTLATLLDVETPSGSSGRVLAESFAAQ
jgi:predicted AlkP superfamily pyrophosphatase or phosphodiesterase